eukprot:IDg10506t1
MSHLPQQPRVRPFRTQQRGRRTCTNKATAPVPLVADKPEPEQISEVSPPLPPPPLPPTPRPDLKSKPAAPRSRTNNKRAYGAVPPRPAPRIRRAQTAIEAERQMPALDTVFTTHVSMLSHVPTRSRHLVRDALTAVMWDFGNATGAADAARALHRLFIFAKCVLCAPAATRIVGKAGAPALSSLVNERLRRWNAGEYGALWKLAMSSATHASAVPSTAAETQRSNHKRAVRLAHEGTYSRAAQALQSDGICEASEEVHAELLRKHPQTPATTDGEFALLSADVQPEIAQHDAFTPSEVRAAVESFPKAAGAGGSGLSAAHILEMVRTPCNKKEYGFLAALTRLCNKLAAGQAPPGMAQWVAAVPVIPLRKRGGSVRPIAIGETVRRLVGKLWMRRLRTRAAVHLLPSQVGVAVSGGAEATVHACRRLADKLGDDKGYGLLQLDFANAFNLVSRAAFLRVVRMHFPELHAWCSYTYGNAALPLLWSGQRRWRSATGVQQGDPLGPMLFALAVEALMTDLRAHLAQWSEQARTPDDKQPASLLALFYCDDGVFVGKHEVLVAVWWPSAPPESARAAYPPEVAQHYGGGTHVLQAPIGDVEYVEEAVLTQVKGMQPLLDAVAEMGDMHVAFTLLRSCFGACRLSHTLRCVPSTLVMRGAMLFDSMIEDALRRLLGGTLPHATFRELQLPVNTPQPSFGVGLQSAESCASAAFLCSQSLCARLLRLLVPRDIDMSLDGDKWAPAAHVDLSERCADGETTPLSEFEREAPAQRETVRKVHAKKLSELDGDEEEDRTRTLRALLALRGSKDWLSCAPSPGLGTHIADRAYRLWFSFWCRLPLFPKDTQCPRPRCNQILDPFGDHLLHCKHSVARGNAPTTWRHDTQLRLLAADLRRVARHPQLEYRKPLEHKSRPDIKCLGAQGGADYVELSIVHPLSSAYRMI